MSRAGIWLGAALAGAGLVQGAHAAMLSGASAADATLLYSGSRLVQGSLASVTPLQLTAAGTLSFSLVDLDFPVAFTSLIFTLSDSKRSLGAMTGEGVMSMKITGPETLYADVFATTQTPAYAGLYNLQANFVPAVTVPLPASGLLMALALALGLSCLWLRPRRTYACHSSYGLMGSR